MMKKCISGITIVTMAVCLFTFNSCKPKAKNTDATTTNETPATNDKPSAGQNPDASARYAISFTPDSATLGKENEMFIKFGTGEALELSDADGKSTGMKVTVNFVVTNRTKIGEGSGIFVHTGEQRLALDNGTSVAPDSGDNKTAQQESSSTGTLSFLVPAGAKPVKLNLFEDETRSAVALTLTKK